MLQNLCPKLSYCFYMWRMWFSFYMMLMGMQHLLGALEAFCLTNGLIVNVTVQRHWYPTVTYKGEHKYLVIDVPTTNKCSICFKLVGNIISCWRINATKVILMEGKWNKCYLIQWNQIPPPSLYNPILHFVLYLTDNGILWNREHPKCCHKRMPSS